MPSQNEGTAMPAMLKGPHPVVDPGVLLDRGDDAERQRQDYGNRGRHDRELQGELEAHLDLVDDRLAGPHRLAQVTGEVAADEAYELFVQRVVQPEVGPAEIDLVLRHVQPRARETDLADVAGEHPQQEEDEKRRPDQGRDHEQQALQDVLVHSGLPMPKPAPRSGAPASGFR